MLSKRDVSPNMYKAVRWFTRILWFGLILACVAAVSYGVKQKNRATEFEKENTKLLEENKALKKAAAAPTKSAPKGKEAKQNGRTIP